MLRDQYSSEQSLLCAFSLVVLGAALELVVVMSSAGVWFFISSFKTWVTYIPLRYAFTLLTSQMNSPVCITSEVN